MELNRNEEPPDELDGAKVLYWCYLPPDDKEVTGAAVCQYEGDRRFYLFWCDADWKVVGDTIHDTIDEATDALWQCCPDAYRSLQHRAV